MSSENSRHWVIPNRRFRPKFYVELRNIFQLDVTCCMALLGSEHLPQGQDLLLRLPQLRLPLLPLTLLLLRAQTLHETTTELLLFLFSASNWYLEICPNHTVCWWSDIVGGTLKQKNWLDTRRKAKAEGYRIFSTCQQRFVCLSKYINCDISHTT